MERSDPVVNWKKFLYFFCGVSGTLATLFYSMVESTNVIDLMPYLEGQKFGWTVDMTHAILKHGSEECNRCLQHARETYASQSSQER
jgi:hypothetical protein